MYRVEDKYTCSGNEMFLLQSRLNAVLRSDYSQTDELGYKITSVYFDSYDDECLRSVEEGARERRKYRIRIYNDSFKTIKLEVKYKMDRWVDKASCSISFEQMANLLHGECIEDDKNGLGYPITEFNLAIRTLRLKPCIIVEYDRKAFVYSVGNVRITLDRNIRTSNDIRGFLAGNTGIYREVPDYSRILEVKYDEFLPGFIARLIENGNMNQVSNSKYRICREYQSGYLI